MPAGCPLAKQQQSDRPLLQYSDGLPAIGPKILPLAPALRICAVAHARRNAAPRERHRLSRPVPRAMRSFGLDCLDSFLQAQNVIGSPLAAA